MVTTTGNGQKRSYFWAEKDFCFCFVFFCPCISLYNCTCFVMPNMMGRHVRHFVLAEGARHPFSHNLVFRFGKLIILFVGNLALLQMSMCIHVYCAHFLSVSACPNLRTTLQGGIAHHTILMQFSCICCKQKVHSTMSFFQNTAVQVLKKERHHNWHNRYIGLFTNNWTELTLQRKLLSTNVVAKKNNYDFWPDLTAQHQRDNTCAKHDDFLTRTKKLSTQYWRGCTDDYVPEIRL